MCNLVEIFGRAARPVRPPGKPQTRRTITQSSIKSCLSLSTSVGFPTDLATLLKSPQAEYTAHYNRR